MVQCDIKRCRIMKPPPPVGGRRMTETLTRTIEPGTFADPKPIEHFDPPGLRITPAEQLERIRVQAPEVKAWLRATCGVERFAARSLVTLPSPTRWALCDARSTRPLPYVWITDRLRLIRWHADGRPG